MVRFIVSFAIVFCSAFPAAAQESDERPRLRRRAKPETTFQESYTEGTLFRANSKTLEGTLKRVECRGQAARIHVLSAGKDVAFDVLDPKLVTIKGTGSSEFEFACGAQKPRTVAVEYVETKSVRSLYTLEFKPTPSK